MRNGLRGNESKEAVFVSDLLKDLRPPTASPRKFHSEGLTLLRNLSLFLSYS